MPLYEFACHVCGARFEEILPAGTAASCPACGNERVTRVFSTIASAPLQAGLKGRAARESDARRTEREAQKKDRFVAERKRKRGEGPPGG